MIAMKQVGSDFKEFDSDSSAMVVLEGQEPLDALETRLRGAPVDWPALVHDSKRAVADGILVVQTIEGQLAAFSIQ